MIAKARGVHVVNVVRRAAARPNSPPSGSTTRVSTADAGWRKQVEATTGGALIVAALDSVGARKAANCRICSARAASS